MSDPSANVVKRNVVKLDQVEWEFSISASSNKVTAKGVYQDDYPSWMSRMPDTNSPHPEIPALLLMEIKATRIPGDMITVSLSYECTDPDAEYPGRKKGPIKRYHMEPSAGEEPLLTNDIFADLTDPEKEAAQELLASSRTSEDFTKAGTILTTEAGLLVLEKVRKGAEAYRSPGLIWVERFTTNNLDDVELPKILKTTDTPPGPCPDAGADDRNWLRLAPTVNPHDDGKTFDIENRWELSLPGRWDPDFYPASA